MRLKGHLSPMSDEAGYNLFYGLDDHFYVRRLVRRIEPKSPAAERLGEKGWAYGDTSYLYGTDPVEVFRFQAGVVAYALFGGDLSLDLFFFCSDDEELYRFLADLRDEEGLTVSPPLEEIEEADVMYGDSATMIAEFTGEPDLIWRLKGALTSPGVDLPGSMLHYAEDFERGVGGGGRSSHFLLLYDCETFPEREVIHNQLFDTLLDAYEAMRVMRDAK